VISLVEALHYRCLRYVRRPLRRFQVLVGPNASGKTTCLDVPALLGRLVSQGLDAAIGERTQNFQDLVWRRQGRRLELAVEASIPGELRERLSNPRLDTIRYEVGLGLLVGSDEAAILSERVLLKESKPSHPDDSTLFPLAQAPVKTILTPKGVRGSQTVLNKLPNGNDNFYDETGKGWDHAFKLGARKSAFGNLPEDESKFPAASWLKRLLTDGIQQIVLNSLLIRRASPPGQARGFKSDGSNLPWVIAQVAKKTPNRFKDWIAHLQTGLPDIEDITTRERPDDKHRYLVVRYRGNIEVPSWMVSDGTLRLLALSLFAYLPDFRGTFLIEEPENGIHPRAVETVFQSLSSVYDAQVLLATHSPVILSVVKAEDVLCFAKDHDGATAIVSGDRHPALRDWKGEENLGVLYASGVLG